MPRAPRPRTPANGDAVIGDAAENRGYQLPPLYAATSARHAPRGRSIAPIQLALSLDSLRVPGNGTADDAELRCNRSAACGADFELPVGCRVVLNGGYEASSN